MVIKRLIFAVVLLAMLHTAACAGGNLGNLGTFHKWHKVEVVLTGPSTSVTSTPNPFEILVNVTFTGPGGTFVVPAFYDADGSGGTSGSVWKVRFSANATGSWSLSSSSSDSTLNGYTGTFTIDEAPDSASSFLKWGRLQYVGGHYLKFADGPYWIKGGLDDPENPLGGGFGTDWNAKKSAIDTLNSKGCNSLYTIMNTISPGDSNDTWPWYGSTTTEAKANSSRYNPSKLLQWEDFFNYCESKGVVLYLLFDDDSAWHSYDHSLYYREMVARFGHHPAIIWNVGEEANENYSDSDQIAYAGTIKNWDAFDHPVTVHRGSSSSSNWPFLGNANFDLTSMQDGSGGDDFSTTTLDNMNACCINNRNGSVSAGRPIPVMFDEYPRITSVNDTYRLKLRSQVLYPIYLGGGNFELHYKDTYVSGGSVTLTTLAPMLDDMRLARQFTEALPFDQMSPNNSLLSSTSGNFCFAKPGLAYGIYLTSGGTISLNLTSVKGAYQVTWYNVTTGATSNGAVIFGGGSRSLGSPAYSGDVACWVKRTTVVPGTSWGTATASDLGVDQAKLTTFGSTVAGNGMIVKDGYMLHQWGTPSTKVNWASASKPTNGTIGMIAINEGRTTMNTAIYPGYWSAATGKDRNITIRHLMNMLSGYMRPENPGAAWSYNDWAINLFTKTLFQKIYGSDPQTVTTTKLAALQFQDAPVWNTGANYGRLTSCSSRDFARIGWMWTSTGRWGSSTILPSTYFDQYCKFYVPTSMPQSSSAGDTSDYLGVGTYGGATNQTSDGPGDYGQFWWFNENGNWPDATLDTYAASGHGGDEMIAMIPTLGLVAVSDGNWNNGSGQSANLKTLKESVVTPGVSDTEAPSIPYNVALATLASPVANSVQVTWSPSVDNIAVKRYKIYRNGTQIGTSYWPSYTDTTTEAGRTYIYSVAAEDYAGNSSALSPNIVSVSDTAPPSVPTDVTASVRTATSAQLLWTASTDNTGVAGYRVYRNGSYVSSSPNTSYIDTGLQPNTTYSYRVSAYDGPGNESAQSSPAATVTTPPLPDYCSVDMGGTNVSDYLSHVTNSDGDTTSTTIGGLECRQPVAPVTPTPADQYMYFAIDDSFLYNEAGTTRYLEVCYYDDQATTVYMQPQYDSTSNAYTSASNVNFTNTSKWKTATWTLSNCKFANGQNVGADFRIYFGAFYAKIDSVRVSKIPWSNYNTVERDLGLSEVYRGLSHPQNSDGDTVVATIGGRDCRRCSASGDNYMYFNVSDAIIYDGSPSTVYLKVVYYDSPSGAIQPQYDSTSSAYTSASTLNFIGTNTWKEACWTLTDARFANNQSGSADLRLSVGTSQNVYIDKVVVSKLPIGGDTVAPSVPTNVQGTAQSQTSIQVTWTASTDNVGVTGYKVFRNGGQVGTSASTSYTDTGLSANTTYSYNVSAYDAAGNNSAQSTPQATATTPDSTAPSVPTNVTATAQTPKMVKVTWTASTDNVGVTGYKIYRNGAQIATTATTSYTDSGLTPNTTYSYAVSAYDAASNNSAQSSPPATATTMQAMDIAAAKRLGDSATVGFVAKTVIAVMSNSFYIEETDRYSGIKIVPTEMPQGLAVGKTVDVGGTIMTNADGERYVSGFANVN